jgi:pyruvate/2-oxoglutarate dehydrogenase complex dihydrolipoamide dehydrogenase (E3) component
MTSTERYDAILVGAGQANNPLAGALADEGWKVALIERKHVGGTCINEGCTPSKTMIASARAAYVARRGPDYGVHTGSVTVDMTEIRARKREIVERFRSANRQRMEETDGIDLLMGEGHFTGPYALDVAMNDGSIRHVTADRIFINTGLRPRHPDLPGVDAVPCLNSTSIMELDAVPEHLLILGGGYVGVEFAQMFRRFGSEVTIVQRSDQLLTHEDDDVAAEVASILREDGITVHLNATGTGVEQNADDRITLQVDQEGERLDLQGSHLLLAAGRVPNVEALDLDAASIETTDRGYIKADARLETNVPDVYALGDVKGGPAFTHISYDDFRIVRTNLLDGGDATITDRLVPYAVFMDPQLGGVGLTERQANREGREVKIAKMPMSHVARAIETNETRGLMKAVIDAETDLILGASILGAEGGEVMSVLQMAIWHEIPYTHLRDGAFAHPTLAESLNNLFMTLED